MKKRKPVVINPQDFRIITLIFEGKNYNEILAKELNIKPSSLFEQLKYLEEKKFIISERKKKHNKKTYSINFKRIGEEFAQDIKNSFLQELKLPVAIYLPKEEIKKSKNKINDLSRELKNNQFLPHFIETLFTIILINKSFEDNLKIIKNIKTFRELFVICVAFLRKNFKNKEQKEILRLKEIIDELFEKYPNHHEKEINDYLDKIFTNIGENGFNATKTTENNKNKSGNTDKNKALSSESKEGENPK